MRVVVRLYEMTDGKTFPFRSGEVKDMVER